ncbi:MAG: tetratricopeptide repeat protein, partial [Acidobacteriota bacterium]
VSATLNLATNLIYSRRIDEGLALHDENEKRVLQQYGADHPAMARIHYSRGIAFRASGEPASALEWIRRSLAINTAHFGPEHNNSLRDMQQVADLMVATGDPAAAATLVELVDLFRRVFGADDRRLAYPLLRLGLLGMEKGELGDAEARLREAVTIRRASLPEGHWRTAQAEGHLGGCLVKRGRLDEAEVLLTSSLEVLRRVDPEHPRTRTVERYRQTLEEARAALR